MALSKSHQDYWQQKLKKRKAKLKDGSIYEYPFYYIRIVINRKNEWFNLESSNQKIAAHKAKEIWTHLQVNGADLTLEKFKSKKKPISKANLTTVGEYIEAIRELNLVSNKQTFETYCRKFRTLVAGTMKIESDNSKCDYVNGGYDRWKGRVEAVYLDQLTATNIHRWLALDLKLAGQTPIEQKKRKITQNSILRNSKSLFSKKYVKHISLALPTVLPVLDVDLHKQPKSRYHSHIDAKELAKAAQKELYVAVPKITLKRGEPGYRQNILDHENAKSKLEQFKILTLALGSGLRRDEIDTLQWRQLNFGDNTIILEDNEDTSLKSDESSGVVDVDEETMTILKSFQPKGEKFVIKSNVMPRVGQRYHHYRCERHFKKLVQWLHKKGIEQRNAIHALRKEFGSIVCKQFGIYIASEMLRHSNINITREHYLERKERAAIKIF